MVIGRCSGHGDLGGAGGKRGDFRGVRRVVGGGLTVVVYYGEVGVT